MSQTGPFTYAARPDPREIDDRNLLEDVLLRRVVAWAVDAFLLACLGTCLWIALHILGFLTLGLSYPLLGLLPAVPVVYQWLSVFTLGATPGQSLLGLAVVRDDDLGPPTSLQALIQAIGFYATLAVGWIWVGVALFTTRKRALHDIVSGLVVVRARALTRTVGVWNMASGGRPIA